ncbi:MAG: flagellar basal body-associated FliL family protein [Planctomycetota bacterium]|jgi:flagellar basal body-associated protein FliL
MADAEEKKQQETQEVKEDTKKEAGEKKSLVRRFLPKVIIVVVLAIFAGAGFTLARLLAGSSSSQTTGGPEQGQSSQLEKGSEADSKKSWYYHLEPVIANLNVDDVTRYVKASLTLEVSSEVDQKKGTVFIDEKKPILTNWLTVYLASLSLDDIRGDNNLKRIQSQVLDAFNEKLFPDSKPKIKNILFKEFAVQ